MSLILKPTDSIDKFIQEGGGKATNMAKLSQNGFVVPDWVCISSRAFDQFIEFNNLGEKLKSPQDLEKVFLQHPLPESLESEIKLLLDQPIFKDRFLAVRSSGLDEDSAENSFAGQFSSYMFQKGFDQVVESLKKCWASGFSERALSYRVERKLSLTDIHVGVVIQIMVNARSAGVAFSRNPITPLDRDALIVSSVWGMGEGLVSGELDADNFDVSRKTLEFKSTLVEKKHALAQAPQGGLQKIQISVDEQKISSLSDDQVRNIAKLAMRLEEKLGSPQDCEWAIENNKLYCVQTRPITTIPSPAFFDSEINGAKPILWDNSNIIESYSGVTSPLTFSFASSAYRQVYVQFCEVMGVPKDRIISFEPVFRNMLGLIRGRIYYNLINWYRLVLLLPGAGNNKGFMETMMGVKQGLKPEVTALFDFLKNPPQYSFFKNFSVTIMTLWRFIKMDTIVSSFQNHFNKIYESARKRDFNKMSLPELSELYQNLDEQILRRWHAPIINDYLCMIFFGLLKKLTAKWVAEGDSGASLQNDLLCGQGDLESTEPTKTLMRIADYVDNGDIALKNWVLNTSPSDIWATLKANPQKYLQFNTKILDFLDKYGFRCVNELKLEEPDLHDDPSFVISAVASYVRMKSYSIKAMEEREQAIRQKAEKQIKEKLSGLKFKVYFWVLKQTRRAVKNRENLRFARTKIFGVVRHIFRAVGNKLTKLGELSKSQDIFYLTVDEIFSYIEGRPVSLSLRELATNRSHEFDVYRKTPPPPDRLLTYGAAGVSNRYPQVLADADLLKSEIPLSDDPNTLLGTPCCPGLVEGVVRVVHDLKDAEGIQGEILVTGRTDPGWVPLYPSCSGLLIERGSLLSHSAVVARELGLPTIVGISGGLMTKLKTGMRVRVDAGRGEVKILQ